MNSGGPNTLNPARHNTLNPGLEPLLRDAAELSLSPEMAPLPTGVSMRTGTEHVKQDGPESAQDAYYIGPGVWVVCDGVSTTPGGRQASNIASSSFGAKFSELVSQRDKTGIALTEAASQSLLFAQQELARFTTENPGIPIGETTISAVGIDPSKLAAGMKAGEIEAVALKLGDSTLARVNKQTGIGNGLSHQEDDRGHLTGWLSANVARSLPPVISPLKIKAGETWALASDGLRGAQKHKGYVMSRDGVAPDRGAGHQAVRDNEVEILRTAGSLQEAAEMIVDDCSADHHAPGEEKYYGDDTTLMLIGFTEKPAARANSGTNAPVAGPGATVPGMTWRPVPGRRHVQPAATAATGEKRVGRSEQAAVLPIALGHAAIGQTTNRETANGNSVEGVVRATASVPESVRSTPPSHGQPQHPTPAVGRARIPGPQIRPN